MNNLSLFLSMSVRLNLWSEHIFGGGLHKRQIFDIQKGILSFG